MDPQPGTLHFDLSWLSPEHEYRLLCGVPGGVPLRRYADEPSKLDEHRSTNAALGIVPEAELPRITHFVEAAPLRESGVGVHRVVFPSLDDHPLPEIAMAFLHIGDDDVQAAMRGMPGYSERRHHHLALGTYGVDPEDAARSYADVHRAAVSLKPPGVTAQTLVMQHPELGTVNGMVAQYVLDTYVTRGISYLDLVQYIQNNGPGTDSQWYNKSWVMWAQNDDGTGPLVPAKANTELVYKDKVKPDWPTVPGGDHPGMPTYALTDEYDPPVRTGSGAGVVGAASSVVSDVLKATKNDDALNGLLWSSQAGTTERSTSAPPTPPPPRAGAAGGSRGAALAGRALAVGTPAAAGAVGAASAQDGAASGFAVKDVTSAYGLWLYDDELAWDNGTKTLTFPVKNWPSRYLGLYVKFLRSDGTPITRADIKAANPKDPAKPFTWVDHLPLELVRPIVEPSDTKNYLSWISSGSALFGAPTPFLTQKADVTFLWPDDATHAAVLLGGLGCAAGFTDWDGDVDIVGVLGTGIVCYGVGAIMLLAQTYVINPFVEALREEWGAVGFYAVCGVIGASGIVVGAGTYDSSFGKMVLSKLASIASGAIFGAVAERIIGELAKKAVERMTIAAGELVAEMTAEEALEQVPIAGWALRIASIAADLAALAATTIECVLSPATYELDVLRTMDLTATVTPSTAHGKDGFAPVWPLVSDHYVIQVTYPAAPGQSGGTTYTAAGPMPTERDGAIEVTFAHIPAGGKVEVTASIYSDNDWLCGLWTSGWVSAVPVDGDAISVGGAITEFLVPLTPSTTYSQKQALVYADGSHLWKITQFSIPQALTPDLDAGGAPSEALLDAFAAEHNPLAAGSRIAVDAPLRSWTIADPQGAAAYAVHCVRLSVAKAFTLAASTYISLLDAGGTTPGSLSQAFTTAQFPLPEETTITVVAKGSSWTIAEPGQPALYSIAVSGTDLVVSQVTSALRVQDLTDNAPPLPAVYPLPVGPTGNQVGALQNIIHNNTEYQLGYAWMASGQNLPLDDGKEPQNIPMYAMQSISTLGEPQDQIIEPTRGFSLPTFLAYDQFGLTELFPLAASFVDQLKDGPVSPAVASEFTAFGRALPDGCHVTVLTAGTSWTIGLPGEEALYQLALLTASDRTSHVAVYAFPVPAIDNFYLDPRYHTSQSPVFYLRGVQLKTAKGRYTFDYGTETAWGRFFNAGSLQGLTVHPQGYVVGVDFVNHKLYALKLPAQALPSDEAPCAMPLAGEGVREGLMQNPQALTISADGRILILEEGNRRVQAFDIKGNPVPSFSVGQPHFALDAAFVPELDAHEASTALVQALQRNTTPAQAPKFALPSEAVAGVIADLDAGVVDATLVKAFTTNGYSSDTGGADRLTTVTTTAGRLWLVTDTTTGAVFDVRLGEDEYGLPDLAVYAASTILVTVRRKAADWLLEDTTNATRYEVTRAAAGGDLTVQQVVAFFPLRDAATLGVTYLDIATETKGYIYVLFVEQTSTAPTFYLDIYSPDGSPLLSAPQSGVNAARLTVDQWRSMFTLGFNVVLGPNSRTEPGVTAWMPSTPDPAVTS